MRTVFKITLLTLMLAVAVLAQGNSQGNSGCDATRSCTSLYFYSAGNLTYVCSAPTTVAPVVVKINDSSLTSIAVSSNVGTVTTADVHGMWAGSTVVVSKSTTDALNGTYTVLTVPSTTTYTIATVGVADGTYNTSNLEVTTNSATTGSPVWRIMTYRYVSADLVSTSLGGGSVSYNYKAKCSDRALY